MQRIKDYMPLLTGLLLIGLALWIPLGIPGAPRLIDLFSSWATTLFSTSL